MIMLNTLPLCSHITFADYANFLSKRFLTPHFTNGAREAHLIFDNPGRLQQTPKHFEQKRRDLSVNVIAGHVCDDITENRRIPSKWRENIVNCRNCKRNLVIFLGQYYMKVLPKQIQPGKAIIIAGCYEGDIEDTAWVIVRDSTPQPIPIYRSNAEETDTRLWVHCKNTECRRILILSPDTDIYHIGLPLIQGEKDIMVRISMYNSRELCFLHLNSLLNALKNDPDLSSIQPNLLPKIMQALLVATGCDYTSYFSGIGKATFLRYFFQHSEFITSGRMNVPGTLADTDIETGFLSFLRLVGVVYMKKHASGFNGMSPQAYFNRFFIPANTPLQNHDTWLENIRQCIWDRVQFENEMTPNKDALHRHWKRVCWVLDFWGQAENHTIIPKHLSDYGWMIRDDTLFVDWDSDINMDTVKERVEGLLKGCGCKTGCHTRQCKCKRKGKVCGEGCNCTNCTNTTQQTPHCLDKMEETSIEEIMEDSVPEDINDIMEWVFGDNQAEGDMSDTEDDSDSD